MKQLVYIAEFKKSGKSSGFSFEEGERLMVDVQETFSSEFIPSLRVQNLVYVIKPSSMGNNIFGVERDLVTISTDLKECAFKVGDVVRHIMSDINPKSDQFIPFRIGSIKWWTRDFWCNSAWGVGTDQADGCSAESLRLATDEEKERFASYINSSDNLFFERMKKIIGR